MDANEEILKRLKQAVAHEAMARETFIPDTNSSTPANIHGLTLDLKGLIIPEGLDHAGLPSVIQLPPQRRGTVDLFVWKQTPECPFEGSIRASTDQVIVMGWCSYVAQEALTDHRIFDEICSLCSKNGFKVQR